LEAIVDVRGENGIAKSTKKNSSSLNQLQAATIFCHRRIIQTKAREDIENNMTIQRM
jgi:hypothetical protein